MGSTFVWTMLNLTAISVLVRSSPVYECLPIFQTFVLKLFHGLYPTVFVISIVNLYKHVHNRQRKHILINCYFETVVNDYPSYEFGVLEFQDIFHPNSRAVLSKVLYPLQTLKQPSFKIKYVMHFYIYMDGRKSTFHLVLLGSKELLILLWTEMQLSTWIW